MKERRRVALVPPLNVKAMHSPHHRASLAHTLTHAHTMGSSEEDDHNSGDQFEDGDGDDGPNAPAPADVKVPFEDTPSEAPLSTTSTWAEDSELRSGLNKKPIVDKGWKMEAKLAPRMSSLAEGTDDEDGLVHSGMPGAIQGKPYIRIQSHKYTSSSCSRSSYARVL